jgi:hypothetical protein
MTWYLQEKTISGHASYWLSTPVDNSVPESRLTFMLPKEQEPKVLQTGSSQQCLVYSFVDRPQWWKKCPGLEFCKVAEKTSAHQQPASLFLQ